MATIEFLTERINKAQETISKKQATIEKKLKLIEKKKASLQKMGIFYTEETEARDYRDNTDAFWTICDIENLFDDIERGGKEIEEKKASLTKYQQDLEKEIAKNNSRNIQVIIDFLNDWKIKTMEFYQNSVDDYLEARAEWWAYDHQYTEWFNYSYKTASTEEYKEKRSERRRMEKRFKADWAWMMPYIDHNSLDTERLQKDIDREADRKYDFIIARTNEIVTEITDASHLYIGEGGELNGNIIGKTGIANVRTIGAGGYNIQRFHFRTLVKRVG